MLAVGERGHQPSATVWSLATGTVVRELAGGHRFGIGCIAFTPSGGGVVTMGFKHDRMLRVSGPWEKERVPLLFFPQGLGRGRGGCWRFCRRRRRRPCFRTMELDNLLRLSEAARARPVCSRPGR